MAEKPNRFQQIFDEVRHYVELNVEYAKLTAAEKITLLLVAVATVLICGVLGVLIFFFISIAAVHWLGEVLDIALAYTIMAGVYVALLAVAIIFKRQLIITPVAKFISRLILK